MNAYNAAKYNLLYGAPPTTLENYVRRGITPHEADECDCEKCQSIHEEDTASMEEAWQRDNLEANGPTNDSWLNPGNCGGTSYKQDMRDAGRGHLV